MMFTVVKDAHFFPGQQPRPYSLPYTYYLYLRPPSTDVPMYDLLLLEALQDPTRKARYKLDAETCAQIAAPLWLSVLPS